MLHVITCPANQHEKQNQEKEKSPQTFAHPVHFSKCVLPCLIIIQSCYFDYRINKLFTGFRCMICVELYDLCSLDLDVPRVQRIKGKLPTNQ